MDDESADPVATCQYPSTVRVSSHCTGVYVGELIVLTAAHCIDHETVGSVIFGESETGDGRQLAVDVLECERYPGGSSDGVDAYDGVDLAYCVLDGSPPDVPITPPMIPTGCTRDWLAQEVYLRHSFDSGPPATMVGMGCSDGYTGSECNDGDKRALEGELLYQFATNESTTKLQVDDTLYGGSGILKGDSGGPVFVQLPDGSWRVVGVLHASGVRAKAEAIPPYLRWLERETGADLTPCHDRADGRWVFHGGCEMSLPLDPTVGGNWSNACQPMPSEFGGGENACGGWDPNPWYHRWVANLGQDEAWAPASVLVDLSVGVLELVLVPQDSVLSLARDEQVIRDYIIDGADPVSVDPFLWGVPPAGYLPLETTADLVAKTVAMFLVLPPSIDPQEEPVPVE